jgi:hypothetical protein
MPDYASGKIYKIVNTEDEEIYIGSTCGSLRLRKSTHKGKAMTRPNRHVYSHLNNVGWDNVRLILIEDWPCENKQELLSREQYWIEQIRPSLNKNSAVNNCPHGRQQSSCKRCGGSSICRHGKRRCRCKPCGGSSICEHGQQKNQCQPCGGASVCVHWKQKRQCNICNPFFCDYCKETLTRAGIKSHYRTMKHRNAYIKAYLDVHEYEPTVFPFDQLVH